jgi:hypothetical protein
MQKSAEVIVVGNNEQYVLSEVSRSNEGLNVKLSPMRLGGFPMLKEVSEFS